MSNPSALGFAEEKNIAETISHYCGVKQQKGLRGYYINPESICTNLKLQVNGNEITENDINFTFKRSSWIANKFGELFYMNLSKGVAIQSKKYSSSVAFERVMHDIVHSLISYKVGQNLKDNTIIIVEDESDKILERKLRLEFGVKVKSNDYLSKYEFIKELGWNSISRNKFVNNSIEKKTTRVKLGKLTIINTLLGVKLINLNRVDCLNNETYEELRSKLKLIKDYLKPSYYVYIAPEGVTPSGKKSLESINSKVINLESLEEILSNNKFFNEFNKIIYQPFGIALMALGEIESKLYSTLNYLIQASDLPKKVNEKNLIKATIKFLTRKKLINI